MCGTLTTYCFYGDEEGIACPVCDGGNTHIDSVTMAGRKREDAPERFVRVEADGSTHPQDGASGESGRRHRIVLHGTCENGCIFDLVFRQHKGVTMLSLVDLTPAA